MIEYKIKKIKPHQLNRFSKILVKVYFETFTNKELGYPCFLRDKYLLKLRNLKRYLKKTDCKIYVAILGYKILGGFFYYKNLDNYGLKLNSKSIKTSGIRYLAIKKEYRGNSIGEALVNECISKTKKDKNNLLVLHTLDTMQEAIHIYDKYTFKRFTKIDFSVGKMSVKGYIKEIK